MKLHGATREAAAKRTGEAVALVQSTGGIATPAFSAPARRAPLSAVLQRAATAPRMLTRADAFELQRTIGNGAVGRLAAGAVPPRNRTGLPDLLKSGVELMSGFALDDVRVRYNSSRPAHVQALAYTQGTHIHVAPGEERHLPHEAWHVVQQKQGRVKPTLQMKGLAINDDAGLEGEATAMGASAVRHGNPARTFSDRPTPPTASPTATIQRTIWECKNKKWAIFSESVHDQDPYPHPYDSKYEDQFLLHARDGVKYDQQSGTFQESEGAGLTREWESPPAVSSTGVADVSSEIEHKDIANLEEPAAIQSRIATWQRVIANLGNAPKSPERDRKIGELQKKLAQDEQALKEAEKLPKGLFKSLGNPQPASLISALFAHSTDGVYYVFPTAYEEKAQPEAYDAKPADGKFEFAVIPSKPTEVLVGQGGHAALTGNKPVVYAGTVYFSAGKLLYWNNDTGHYHTTATYAPKTQIAPTDNLAGGLLPMKKFLPFTMQ